MASSAVVGASLVLAILTLLIVFILVRLHYIQASVHGILDGKDQDGADQDDVNEQLGQGIGQNADFGRQLAQRTLGQRTELDALKDRVRLLEEYAKYDKADTRVQTLEEDLAEVNERNESYKTALQQQLSAKASETSVVSRLGYLEKQIQGGSVVAERGLKDLRDELHALKQNLQSRLPAGQVASEASVRVRLEQLLEQMQSMLA